MYIEFDHITHKYYADGELVPSVSEIISPLNDLSIIPQEVLDVAAIRGTFLHNQIEKYYTHNVLATTAFVRESTPIGEPDYNLWWKGFIDWEDRQSYKPLIQEQFMIGEYEGLKFGFTCDFLGRNGELIDWKTASALKKSYAVQLEAYKIGLEFNEYKVNSLAIGHLRKDKPFRLVNKDTLRQKVFCQYGTTDRQVFIEHLIRYYRENR